MNGGLKERMMKNFMNKEERKTEREHREEAERKNEEEAGLGN